MVTNLVIAESQHEAIEEQFFWPAVREAVDNGDELADEAIAQEQEGKTSATAARRHARRTESSRRAAGIRQVGARTHQVRAGSGMAGVRSGGQSRGSREDRR